MKRKRKNDINKKLKNGDGQGILENYKPWIKIQDFPSYGRVTRLKGIKTGRQHEFLSDLERNFFYYLEFSDKVIDIREQYPLLPLEETLLIADELGIKHPTDFEGKPVVMTTDFLITKSINGKNVDVARTVKLKDDLSKKRVIEKFEIERRYWEKTGIDWGIVTELEISKIMAKNISDIIGYRDIKEVDALKQMSLKEIKELTEDYIKLILFEDDNIRNLSRRFDETNLLKRGTALAIFKNLISRKIIKLDLRQPINLEEKLQIDLDEELLEKELMVV